MAKMASGATNGVSQLPKGKALKQSDIIAAEKIIADISSGIYRSPAAALKELVSNAYDADATEVLISSDAPNFRTLVIHDNGSGMSIDTFLQVVQHIGGSRKRFEGDRTPIYKRPLIGRIGIGMLAVAQLSNRFYVSSSVKGQEYRFIAEVNLDPFHKDDAALKSMGRVKNDGQVQIGAVRYVDDIPESTDAHYTVITVPDAKKGLISEMTSAVRKAVGAQEVLNVEEHPIDSFDELVNLVRSAKRADLALDGYYYMLWELGLLSPVNYCIGGPFDTSQRPIINAEAYRPNKINDFRVVVDNIELHRPQLFPNTCALNYASPDPIVYPLAHNKVISGRRLAFTGYIYSQQPRVDPEEMRGIHIRIRNVGIGMYDKTWLGYPFNEGLKFGQVTGELFIDEGLEPALNIDRDSFRETDVHYQALRAFIWDFLRQTVFPEFKSRGALFRNERREDYRLATLEQLSNALSVLPSPVNPEPAVVERVKPTIGTWISVNNSKLLLQRDDWEGFIEENTLAGVETQKRFLRVLAVLASSEILQELTDEEIGPLLRAIAAAVQ
jgi:hypothetical protein